MLSLGGRSGSLLVVAFGVWALAGAMPACSADPNDAAPGRDAGGQGGIAGSGGAGGSGAIDGSTSTAGMGNRGDGAADTGQGGEGGAGGSGAGDAAVDAKPPGMDSSALGSDGATDAGSLGGGSDAAGGPGDCPVGPSDGCCPIALRHGGVDPDCAALGCSSFSRSDPVLLDDPNVVSGDVVGTAALSWTGSELAIAWVAFRESTTGKDVWFERRDAAGGLAFGPILREGFPTAPMRFGPARLGYDGTRNRFLFAMHTVTSAGGGYWAAGLQGDGMPTFAVPLGSTCNGFGDWVDVFRRDDRWMAAHMQHMCDNTPPTGPTVFPIDNDGTRGTPGGITDSSVSWGGSGTYDPGGDRQLLLDLEFGSYLSLEGRFLDLETHALTDPVIVVSRLQESLELSAVAFDGQRYGILVTAQDWSSGIGWRYGAWFYLWDPATGVGQPTIVMGYSNRRLAQARLIWTGDGFVAAATTTFSDDSSGVSYNDEPEAWIFSFAPDGTLRESFQLDPDSLESRFPDIVRAGDRLAVTWARRHPTNYQHWHLLQYLSCEPGDAGLP